MKKHPGFLSATRLWFMPALRPAARCLAMLLSVCAAIPAVAAGLRPEHSTHAHRISAQEEARRPDFSRSAATPKKRSKSAGKTAPNSAASGSKEDAGREHAAGHGTGHAAQPESGPGSRSGSKAGSPPHKAAPKRRRTQPEGDYEPRTVGRASARQPEPVGPAARRGAAKAAAASEARESNVSRENKIETAGALTTDDFLRAAHREPSGAQTAGRAARPGHATPFGPFVPYAAGVSHPPAAIEADAAGAAPRPAVQTPRGYRDINESQIAADQRVAIGEALRPASVAQPLPARSSIAQRATESAGAGEVSEATAAVEADTRAAAEEAVRAAALTTLSPQQMAAAAVQPDLPGLYSREGQPIMPAPLKGSHEVLVHQNEMATAAGLARIRNDAELDRLRSARRLVDFPDSEGLRVNPELPERRRCARPWTVKFASEMGKAFYAEFHEPFTVSSAVRTVSYQRRLQRVNGNAAATSGEGASPHLTGQAFDIGKTGLTAAQIAWLRTYLLPRIQSGAIDVEEEFQQACFHISVYPGTMPHRAAHTQIASIRP